MKPLAAAIALFLTLIPVSRAEHITIGLAIPQGVTDGGEMAATAELGLFKAENLEPEFLVFQGAGALLPQIATKQVTIGLPLTEPVLASYQPGNAPLPVVFFYNANPYNGLELAVLASSPVHCIADLKGRAIGVGAMTWGTRPARSCASAASSPAAMSISSIRTANRCACMDLPTGGFDEAAQRTLPLSAMAKVLARERTRCGVTVEVGSPGNASQSGSQAAKSIVDRADMAGRAGWSSANVISLKIRPRGSPLRRRSLMEMSHSRIGSRGRRRHGRVGQ